MNCKTAREASLLALYDEIDGTERARLEEHLRGCPACAADAAETRRVLALYDAYRPAEAPEPDWEKAWRAVREAVLEDGRRRRPVRAFGMRWALAGVSLALVLVLGIVIGRFGWGPQPGPSAPVTASAAGPENGVSTAPALRSHLDEIQPVILDVANATNGSRASAKVLVDAEALRGLLFQNLLLRRALRDKDPAAAELLDDLDLVLKQLANADPADPAVRAAARDLIRERGVVFKMDILRKS